MGFQIISALRAFGGDLKKNVHFRNKKKCSHDRNTFQHQILQKNQTTRAWRYVKKNYHFQSGKYVHIVGKNSASSKLVRAARLGGDVEVLNN